MPFAGFGVTKPPGGSLLGRYPMPLARKVKDLTLPQNISLFPRPRQSGQRWPQPAARTPEVRPQVVTAAPVAPETAEPEGFTPDDLVKGIIMAELLRPPWPKSDAECNSK